MQAPARGTAAILRYDFPASFSEFSFRTLLTKAEVIQALGKLRAECNKVISCAVRNCRPARIRLDASCRRLSLCCCLDSGSSQAKAVRSLAAVLQVARMSMFNVFADKRSKMEEFEQAQAQMTDQVSNTLRDGWVSSLKQVIKGSLRDVGKECRKEGWCMSQDEPSSCAQQEL